MRKNAEREIWQLFYGMSCLANNILKGCSQYKEPKHGAQLVKTSENGGNLIEFTYPSKFTVNT